jgi:hypothetical protein
VRIEYQIQSNYTSIFRVFTLECFALCDTISTENLAFQEAFAVSTATLDDLVAMRRRIDHPTGRVRPPDLDDPAQFVRKSAVPLGEPGEKFRPITKVPLLDTCDVPGKLTADAHDLARIVANTNRRVERGEYPLLTIGHFKEDQPETEQPPLVGYLRNFVLGTFRGEPCILADQFIDVRYYDEVLTYPRRSVELWLSGTDGANYIDSVACLRRSPERDLGLITFSREARTVQMAKSSSSVLDTPDRRLAQFRRDAASPGFWTADRRAQVREFALKRGIANLDDAKRGYLESLEQPYRREVQFRRETSRAAAIVQLRRESSDPSWWTEERRAAMRQFALRHRISDVGMAKTAYLETLASGS